MPPKNDIEDADPALARQRTRLAWTRTAIAFAALGGAILKSHPAGGVPVLAASVVVWELGRLPRRQGSGQTTRRLLAITVTVTTVAAVSLLLSFLGTR